MKGTPGQIKVTNDVIAGDGGNYRDQTVDIRGGILARVHQDGLSFVDRGDPSGYDFDKNDFITDGSWHPLDLSSIVPKQAKAILVSIYLKDDAVGSYFKLRAKDANDIYNNTLTYTQVANIAINCDCVTPITASKVEYRASSVTFTNINIIVKGWWQ